MRRLLAAIAFVMSSGCTSSTGQLPLVELRAIGPRPAPAPVFAVMLTGDGGWRPIDERVSQVLRRNGIPVVGFLTNRYFAQARTPDETAADVVKVIRKFMAKWNDDQVILAGYSRGADTLPFVVRRLPADLVPKVRVVALFGPANATQLHKRLFGVRSSAPTLQVRPEIDAMPDIPLMCFWGAREDDTVCPALPPGRASVIRMPGGHHFDGRYEQLGQAIVDALRK
jgi:Type IV secretory pathway, VirJ component